MRKLLLFILPVLLFSCQSSDNSEIEPVFTSTDSTAMVQEILESLEAEMYTQWFMDTTAIGLTCYNSPEFNPALSVRINDQGMIMVKDVLNPKSISDMVVEFYSTNLFRNYLTNNDPMYSRVSKNEIINEIDEQKKKLKNVKNTPNVDPEIIVYYQNVLYEWESKLKLFSILAVDTLSEPQFATGIKFKYSENCNIYDQILDSILLGFYKIREIDSRIYYKESYAKIFWKATKLKDSIEIEQLIPFKTLHPVHILDYGKSRYKPYTELPPPPIEPYIEIEDEQEPEIVEPPKTE